MLFCKNDFNLDWGWEQEMYGFFQPAGQIRMGKIIFRKITTQNMAEKYVV